MKKALLLTVFLISLFSCDRSKEFTVTGKVEDAAGRTLIIEYTGLQGITALDSLKLDKNGNFIFKEKSPAYPDFYRLRIDNKYIVFSIDSCESIQIDAAYFNFASNYTVTGSESSGKIKQLRLSLMDIQRKVNEINTLPAVSERKIKFVEVEKQIEAHKEMAAKMIFEDPHSTYAYFAVFQKVNNSFLFSPYIKKDKPYCAAVATAYHTFMPDYDRSKNLYNLVMDAIKNEHIQKQNEAWGEILEKYGTGYIDITLPDKNEITKKLSDVIGYVVLVDFSAFQMEESVQYIFALRELYNKYHAQGFEIFQVSLDRNKLLWEESVENIPWICVHDIDSKYAGLYNIPSIPTTFLLDKNGDIVGKNISFSDLDLQISNQLKKR